MPRRPSRLVTPRLRALLSSLLLLLPAPLPGQLLGLHGADDAAPPGLEASNAEGVPSASVVVHEPDRPFVLGRDNPAFSNPSGAISIPGFRGNCYAMSAVAKLFHRMAEFRPEERVHPTLRNADVAAALRSSAYPRSTFPVRGFEGLHALSATPPDAGAESWMEGWARWRAGLEDRPPEGPVPTNVDGATQVYQLVTALHYLHYMRFQADSLVESAARYGIEGSASVPRILEESRARVRSELSAGRLPLVLMFDPRPEEFMGHVILGYRMEEVPGAESWDLYVYDSNIHYRGSPFLPDSPTDEAFVRIHGDGRMEMFGVDAAGEAAPLPSFEHDGLFTNPDSVALMVLDDPEEDPDLRLQLADLLDALDEAVGHVLAAGDLLRRLTGRSPEESNLFEDVRDFLGAADRVGGGPSLSAAPSVEEVNAYLASHEDEALRLVFPMALPEGVTVEEVGLRFDPAAPGRATLRSTVTVSRSASIDGALEALHASALLEDRELADLVEAVGAAFEGQVVRLTTELALEKGEPRNRLGRYGPVAELRRSHLVVGDVPASSEALTGDHRVEVAERVVAGFVDRILERRGIVRERVVDESLGGGRRGYVFVRDVDVDCHESFLPGRPGELRLGVDYYGFLGVRSASEGIFIEDEGTHLGLRLEATELRNVLEVEAALRGRHSLDDGLLGISSLALDTFAVEVMEETMRPFLSAILRDELSSYVTLRGRGPEIRNIEVSGDELSVSMRPFEVDVEATLVRVLGMEPGQVPVHLIGVQVLEDRVVVDLANDR